MSGEVSRQDQALTRGAQMVVEAKGDLEGQLRSLEGRLQGIGGQWRGSGASAFTSVMVRWNESARRLTGALEGFEANLRASESTYTASDEQESSTYSGLSGRMG